jgi:5'-nucleotidase
MAYSIEGKLVIGITSRALFDLDEADAVHKIKGLTEYRADQREREQEVLAPGTAFPLVRALLAINARSPERLVEVIVISRNDADSGVRILNSIHAHSLDITRAAFTDGRDAWIYLVPFRCNLFLSAEPNDIDHALNQGVPAALILPIPKSLNDDVTEVRVAFDGDAVLFDDKSERVFEGEGLDAFQQREVQLGCVDELPNHHPGCY